MALARNAKKSKQRKQTKRTSTNPPSRRTNRKPPQPTLSSVRGPTASQPARVGLRSAQTGPVSVFKDDPEALLRKHRKPRKGTNTAQSQHRRTQSQVSYQPGDIVQSVEEDITLLFSPPPFDLTDDESSLPEVEKDPEEAFNRWWGYLPPLGEEAAAIIDAILQNPTIAGDYARIHPEHSDFPDGLSDRNVLLEESGAADPYADRVQLLPVPKLISETADESECHGWLWAMDRAKCNQGSNEALFQRTLMMGLIARHCFMYGKKGSKPPCLDYSVEETWTCFPMPTRAYSIEGKFLTQPRPDLAVSFRRREIISDATWNQLPKATKRLACLENVRKYGATRIFHFFTIEAKKAEKSSDDTVGMFQSLNNASQALHNMFEFFRDAGRDHEKIFFDNVRFFSAVACTEGLTIRIHRATRDPADGSGQGLIMEDRPDYPLRFEFREFCSVSKKELDRRPVLEMLERILQGYGVGELGALISNAAKALVAKLKDDLEGRKRRTKNDYYRYGQIRIPPNSRAQTSV